MNLLVTGGAGFIGSNYIEAVIGEPAVQRLICLDALTYAGHLANLEAVRQHPKFVFEKIDLRDKAAVIEAVRRHATTVGTAQFRTRVGLLLAVTIRHQSIGLLAAALEAQVKVAGGKFRAAERTHREWPTCASSRRDA